MAFLNYHHLRYFWATVKEAGVTRASRKLNVTQPTVSSQIRELEEAFEQPLLDRNTQKVVLTEAGLLGESTVLLWRRNDWRQQSLAQSSSPCGAQWQWRPVPPPRTPCARPSIERTPRWC